jgi:hypothetical protein
MMEGVNSTMIYYKNFCKCTLYSQYINKKKIRNISKFDYHHLGDENGVRRHEYRIGIKGWREVIFLKEYFCVYIYSHTNISTFRTIVHFT